MTKFDDSEFPMGVMVCVCPRFVYFKLHNQVKEHVGYMTTQLAEKIKDNQPFNGSLTPFR